MTRCVYGAEDLFARLPLHWSWWPALGGFVVGIGGLIDPRALGVGYDTIGAELAGQLALGTLAVLLVVKLAIWSIALGSNTSGGILAPLLMLGAALGGLLGAVLPGADEGTWALLGMAAALAGVTRSPFTSIVFALELTHDVDALLPLLVACTIAHLVSVLTLKRSILTEKIARRGYHVTREYEVDPLHALLVRDVMSTDVLTVAPSLAVAELYEQLPEGSELRRQRLYPVLEVDEELLGVLAFSDVLAARRTAQRAAGERAGAGGAGRVSPMRHCAKSPTGWSPAATGCCRSSIAATAATRRAGQPVRPAQGTRARAGRGAPPRASTCAPPPSRDRGPARWRRARDDERLHVPPAGLQDQDYRRLLAFRSELRDFLRWSEQAAHDAGLTPSLHQLLLVVRGHPSRRGPTIGQAAEELHIRHHSAVELAQRAEAAGLLQRVRDEHDHRRVYLEPSARGRERLELLTSEHLPRIQALAAALELVVSESKGM